MPATIVNLNGINELDLNLAGTVTATTAAGVTTINQTGVTGLELEVNGTPNADQALLNLVPGANVTITDGGSGNITIAASGGGGGTVTSVTASAPITSSGGTTPNIAIGIATTSATGVVKADGTSISVDGAGTLSAIGAPPTGTAGGDLNGSFPNPGVVKVNGASVPTTQTFVGTNGSGQFVAATLPIVIGFIIGNGTPGTNVGPDLLSPRASSLSKCVVVVKNSDATIGLTINVKKNGTTVFSSNPTVAAGSGSGTVFTFTSLTTVPTAVAANDVFTIDVLTGTSNWQFTAQME